MATKRKPQLFRVVQRPDKIFLFYTGNDRYSGHGYSGIHRYSGTKTPDDAILFTVSGITAIVEQKFRFFPKILMRCSIFTVVSALNF